MDPRTAVPAVLISVVAWSFMGAACSPPTSPTPVPGPAGTYRLSGSVIDATSAAPMRGAVVEARIAADETMPISATVAGSDGKYSLFGVPGVTYVRVIQYGYFDVNERVELKADGTRNFTIARDPSAPDLNGSYTLAIETDAACPSAPSPLPPNLRRRTFPARIEHVGSRLTVTVSSPCVGELDGGCKFAGLASTSGATFQISDQPGDAGYCGPPSLLERLRDREGLRFLGVATTNFSATGLLGSLAGTITYHPIDYPSCMSPSTAGCGAGRFELTRR